MKKLTSLLLALTLCLSLCACGKADDYEAAVALMDSENYKEALTAFTELGDYEDSIQKKAECETAIAYKNAVELLNSGEYQQAYNALCPLADYRDVPDLLMHFKEIAITPDNWMDYFTISETPNFTKNDFNEILDLDIVYDLTLNEDVLNRIYDPSASKVIFEFGITVLPRDVDLDKANGTYTISDSPYPQYMENIVNTLTWNLSESREPWDSWVHTALLMRRFRLDPDLSNNAYSTAEEITVLRAEGSIFIYE